MALETTPVGVEIGSDYPFKLNYHVGEHNRPVCRTPGDYRRDHLRQCHCIARRPARLRAVEADPTGRLRLLYK